ncbi:hypothetical protein LTR60_002267 [Cryomyces antarcticus]|nr:hypothetical protein LTR60_002267 [Cryomyces antarcticus]
MDNKTPLHSALSKRLENRRIQSTLRQLTRTPHVSVDFSSNDFLSLSSSSLLRTAYLAELQRQSPACPLSGASSFPLGSGGSRLLDGNSAYAEQLEKQIARFHNAPAALLCNSGFDANAGLFACLPQPGDVILHDELIHASVHDGMRLSRASRRVAFAHNSVEDLEQVLESLTEEDDELRDGRRNVFVAVEAIYSMDGDLAPLTEIVEVVERLLPRKNGHIIVDEAHSTGVLGPKGRGLVSELGLEKRIFVRLHTFGKALACNGGDMLDVM